MAIPTTDLASSVYTPRQVGQYTYDVIASRQDAGKVRPNTGISSLDQVVHALLPGELCVVLAYTGNYKTGFMSFWARRVAERIENRPDGDPAEMVVYASWETAVEELGAMDFARTTGLSGAHIWHDSLDIGEMQTLQKASKHREALPIWIIGHSITRRQKRVPLTLKRIGDALDAVETHWQRTPAIMYLDHLQEIDTGPGEDRREKVLRNVEGAKQLARELACPVVLGVQAGRQCMERGWKLPELSDGQETSRIEQVADKVLALWLPAKTEAPGTMLENTGWTVTPNMLVLGVRKQRFGESGAALYLRVDFATNEIAATVAERME
jgi:replicative DNA helicase